MKYYIILVLLILFISTKAKAQFFQTGQDPSYIRWRQINTQNFQIIFPEDFENEAQRLAFVLDKVYEYGGKTLNFSPRKISVILHTRTVNSNGLVAWAPKRIELYTTPNQQIYSQDWLEQLALHEFRHTVQMDKIQNELPLVIKAILGEQAAAAVVGAYLPFWFLEGDAVVTETALSKSGRGRMAAFSMEYRALLAEKNKYSFDKSYLGSFRDFVPDHYKLGYWMVGKSREKFGANIWNDVMQKAGKRPFSLTPVNSSLKKATGLNTKQLYNQLFDELRDNWRRDLLMRRIDSLTVISPPKKQYTNYLYPSIYKDSLVVAYRTSLNDIGRFVLISRGQSEQIIYTPGTVFEESVSLQENLLIWSEKRADLRWTHADRSVVQLYNLDTRSKVEIEAHNKLFSPAISPGLNSFAAVEVDHANNFYLSIFDFKGQAMFRYHDKDNRYFFTPCWNEKGDELFAVSLSAKGKSLISVNLKNGLMTELTDPTHANITNPAYKNGQIFFASDFSGVDLIYSLSLYSKKIVQIVSVPFGADYPDVAQEKNRLVFSNYTSSGFQIAAIELEQKNNQFEINDLQHREDSLSRHLSNQEGGTPDLTYSGTTKYSTKKYSKLGHLFNFHSWAPAYVDFNSYEIKPGLSLFSQNKLGTAETRIGYDYNVANRTGQYKLAFMYLGWFPEISGEFSTGKQASQYAEITNTYNRNNILIASDTTTRRYEWKETAATLNLRIPLNLSRGKYFRVFNPEIQYSYNQVMHLQSTPLDFYSGNYHALTYRLYFYNILRQSQQNLQPVWGQQVEMIFRNTPFKGNDLGLLAGLQTAMFFPGLKKNHGLKVYQGYQEKKFSQSYSFANFVRFPRGFQSSQTDKMYSLAIDYKLPLFYPDFSVGKLLYIKRLKADIFYDFAWISIPAKNDNGKILLNYHEFNLRSFGMELTSDVHFLRFFAPVELGIRTSFDPDHQVARFDFLFSINLNGF